MVSDCVCSGEVNSTGTFNADALVKVFEPSEDDDFANSLRKYSQHVNNN